MGYKLIYIWDLQNMPFGEFIFINAFGLLPTRIWPSESHKKSVFSKTLPRLLEAIMSFEVCWRKLIIVTQLALAPHLGFRFLSHTIVEGIGHPYFFSKERSFQLGKLYLHRIRNSIFFRQLDSKSSPSLKSS